MPSRIEDYALVGDCQTAALVARDGSIDWLCWPRFDSEACFAALLGTREHGRWLIAPVARSQRVSRRYRDGTLMLETDFETTGGAVRLIDFMPVRNASSDLVRIVFGLRGRVRMRMELVLRFDYGASVPWVQSPSRWQPARDRGPGDDCAANAGAAARRRTDHDVATSRSRRGQRCRSCSLMRRRISRLPRRSMPERC